MAATRALNTTPLVEVDGSGGHTPYVLLGAGASGATTIADGGDIAQGAKADAAATTDTGTFTEIALLKRLLTKTGTGAANFATSQVAASTTAGTLLAARATRRNASIKNMDGAITVFVGPATVTAGNGMEIKAGQSFEIDWIGLIQVISASGTPTICTAESWD